LGVGKQKEFTHNKPLEKKRRRATDHFMGHESEAEREGSESEKRGASGIKKKTINQKVRSVTQERKKGRTRPLE